MNGVTSIALAIAFSSGVAITMKVANAENLKLGQFLAVNYLVCSLGILGWGAWRTLGFNSPFIWSLGIFVGIMYVLCLWLFNRAIASGGLALSTTLMRLSAAIPTLGSLILFAEQTNLYQILGIVLAFICLPLASKQPLRFDQAGKEAMKGMLWGLLLFAAYLNWSRSIKSSALDNSLTVTLSISFFSSSTSRRRFRSPVSTS